MIEEAECQLNTMIDKIKIEVKDIIKFFII